MFTDEEKKILKTCISTEILEIKKLIIENPEIGLDDYLEKLENLKGKINMLG